MGSMQKRVFRLVWRSKGQSSLDEPAISLPLAAAASDRPDPARAEARFRAPLWLRSRQSRTRAASSASTPEASRLGLDSRGSHSPMHSARFPALIVRGRRRERRGSRLLERIADACLR